MACQKNTPSPCYRWEKTLRPQKEHEKKNSLSEGLFFVVVDYFSPQSGNEHRDLVKAL